MTSRTILITGCSSGIGKDTAYTLKKKGWRVFASCRQETDCVRLRENGFESVVIDYSDHNTIKSGLSSVLEATNGTLDALFNNGAHGLLGAVEDLPTQGLREIFESNFFGWHELTRLVIPIMRAQGYGRIIQCSSVLGFAYLPWRGAYTATKHALEAISNTLRVELRDTNIHIVLLEPGPITSQFRVNSIPIFERWFDWQNSPNKSKYESVLLQRLYEGRGRKDPFELPPSAVSKKVIHALEASKPRSHYMITGATYLATLLTWALPIRVLDRIVAKIY